MLSAGCVAFAECLPLESVSVELGGYILTDKLFFLIAICVKKKTTNGENDCSFLKFYCVIK